MSRLRTMLEWTAILVTFLIIGLLVFWFFLTPGIHQPSGLPDGNGGFYQTPISPPVQFTRTVGEWQFTFPSSFSYTLAGRVVGRHEYPSVMPDGIIPLDLAVVNGDLLKPGMLSFFTITMGYHTLEYSYDVPNYTGLTEEYIDEHISNNHLLFLDPALETEMMKAEVGSLPDHQGQPGGYPRIFSLQIVPRKYQHGQERFVSCRLRGNPRHIVYARQLRELGLDSALSLQDSYLPGPSVTPR